MVAGVATAFFFDNSIMVVDAGAGIAFFFGTSGIGSSCAWRVAAKLSIDWFLQNLDDGLLEADGELFLVAEKVPVVSHGSLSTLIPFITSNKVASGISDGGKTLPHRTRLRN